MQHDAAQIVGNADICETADTEGARIALPTAEQLGLRPATYINLALCSAGLGDLDFTMSSLDTSTTLHQVRCSLRRMISGCFHAHLCAVDGHLCTRVLVCAQIEFAQIECASPKPHTGQGGGR